MHLDCIWLSDFRNYEKAEVAFNNQGLTLIAGGNGQGKTNLIEAIAYLSNGTFFRRGNASEVLIKDDSPSAIVRGEGFRNGRQLLIERSLLSDGRSKALVNRLPARVSDTSKSLVAITFTPDDLDLVKGSPSSRRSFMDDLLCYSDKVMAAIVREVDRCLRQRNVLLKQSGGRLTKDISITLDVWDEKLSHAGEKLSEARNRLLGELSPFVNLAYKAISQLDPKVELSVQSDWKSESGGLERALLNSREKDLKNKVTTAGPHRDEVLMKINGRSARDKASQGEQRTLALALRLASHDFLSTTLSDSPILLLDDVFSELDNQRRFNLLNKLNDMKGQAFLTCVDFDEQVKSENISHLYVEDGKVFS